MTNKARIAMITENLAENEQLFRSGKRLKQLWASCKRDGMRRISELRVPKKKLKV